MINGMPSKTFSLTTLPPPKFEAEEGRREKIVRLSRERYCTPREVVEDKILRWAESGEKKLPAQEGKSFKKGGEKPKLEKPKKEEGGKEGAKKPDKK